MRLPFKKLMSAVLALLAVLSLPAAAAEGPGESAEAPAHVAYMQPAADGNFHPYAGVARSETVTVLCGLLGLPAGGECPYTDVFPAAKWYGAVCALYEAGALPEEESLRPTEPVTLAELADMLSALGLTAPEAPGGEAVSRGEFCAVINRAFGRSCDEAALFLNGTELFADVPATEEYFADIMEAAVPHGLLSAEGEERWLCSVTEPGRYYRDGLLFCVGEDGTVLRDATDGILYFGTDGAYTTGSAELDSYVREALRKAVTPGKTGYKALREAYLYIKNNYDYKNLGLPVEPFEAIGWENDRALVFFRRGGDTCYGFAAAFGLLARGLGFDAHIISGSINEYYYPHSWVIITYEGEDFLYDVELEYARPSRHGDWDLYAIRNGQVYNYWYDPWW